MALFELTQGAGGGNKLSDGTYSVNDSATINTGLSSIRAATYWRLGTNTVFGAISLIAAGVITVSLASPQVASATAILSYATVTVVNTVHVIATGS